MRLSVKLRYALVALAALIAFPAAFPHRLPAFSESFLPHGFCYLWNTRLLVLHVVSDSLIAASYLAISAVLAYLVWRAKGHLPLHWVFIAFGTFIVACGFTHLVEVIVIWRPVYWFAGFVKAVTALASVTTAIALPTTVPVVLTLIDNSRLSQQYKERLEEALSGSEHRNRILLDSTTEGIFGLDTEGCVTFANNSARKILKLPDDYLGIQMHNSTHHKRPDGRAYPWEECPIYRAIRTREQSATDEVFWTMDGERVDVELTSSPVFDEGSPTSTVVVFRDVRERKMLQEQFLQSQRMEAVGQLAAGIAHDSNNITGVIMGQIELLRRDLTSDSPGQRRIDSILQAAKRSGSLNQQLLAFSRRQVLAPKVISLNDVINESTQLLGRTLGEQIRIITRLEPNLMSTLADPGKIQQVILNLAINARDAMPNGGDLIIGTNNVDVDESFVEYRPEMEPGKYAVLAVTDTGIGMDAATRTRIFEPFFTTKPLGKGTGLGLATVYGIIRQSGGQIWVYSEPGQGTTFKIYLPAIGKAPESLGGERQLSSTGGSETILVAEDEPDLREVIVEILSSCGYKVLTAEDASKAVGIAEKHNGNIDLLITDMVMPGTSGPEMANRVASRFPNIKTIFMSGYSADAFKQGVGSADYYLEKPFSSPQLMQVVRKVLDATAPKNMNSRN